jgi:AraC-like DNA-binding protein
MSVCQTHRHIRTDFRLSCEARPASFEGPQRACHLDELEFCIIESGAEKARTENGPIETHGKGTYDLLAPTTVHSSWSEMTPVVETIVHFKVDWLRSLHEDHGLPALTQWRTGRFTAPQETLHVTHMLRQTLQHQDDNSRDLMISSLVTYLAAHLIRRHHNPSNRELGGVSQRLRRTAEWMQDCPTEQFTVERLAESAGMSQYHFLRTFKKQYGVSPYAFLLQLRVKRATELVLGTDMPFTHVAMDSGLGSSSRLSEAIRKEHGVTPTELRWSRREGA